jgi:hypothetical protein
MYVSLSLSCTPRETELYQKKDIAYGLYLHFIGLSYRNAAKALNRFEEKESGFHLEMGSTINHRV